MANAAVTHRLAADLKVGDKVHLHTDADPHRVQAVWQQTYPLSAQYDKSVTGLVRDAITGAELMAELLGEPIADEVTLTIVNLDSPEGTWQLVFRPGHEVELAR